VDEKERNFREENRFQQQATTKKPAKKQFSPVMSRGRPPTGSSKVGMVNWNENLKCFQGTKGYYWHGTGQGGWKKERPLPLEERQENLKRVISEKSGKQRPRARPPNGNDKVGMTVEYCHDENCFKTEKGFYWHGTFKGGWKKYKPGEEGDDADLVETVGKKMPQRGRPPRPRGPNESVFFDKETFSFKSTSGEYWHGTYKGGWKSYPPKRGKVETDSSKVIEDDTDTEVEEEEEKSCEEGKKLPRRGRKS